MRARGLFLACLMVAAIALVGCGKGDSEAGSAESQALSVQAYDYYFDPTAINVNLSAAVTLTFKNNGSVTHSFSSPDLDIETISDSAQSTSIKFTAPAEPGSYDFFCKYHPDQMKGTLSVGGEGAPPVEEQPGSDETTDTTDDDTEDESGAGY